MAERRSIGQFAWLLFAATLVVAAPAIAERQPFDRYQSIVDRQMFGPLPVGFDPTKSPAEVAKSGSAAEKELTKEQEKVKSAIRFSVINVTPEGETAIGFTDNSDPKAPVHYYLKVGDPRGGWEVKEADAKEASMTIAKDGIEVSLKLGGDSAKDGGTQSAQSAAPATAFQKRSPMLNTLGDRRRAREAREEAARLDAAKREAAAKAREEEERVRREEEKAQREAEREEQRRQLDQIREELKKAREEREAQEKEKESKSGDTTQVE